MGVIREIWQGTKILAQYTWLGSKFIIKNTPATLGMLWEVKKEINAALAKELHDAKVEYKRYQLENKINQLQPTKKASSLDDLALEVQDLRKYLEEAKRRMSND